MKISVRTAMGLVLGAAATASAQPTLYAVDFPGRLFTVDTNTGAATLVGATGFDRLNAAAADSSGTIYASRGRNAGVMGDSNQLIRIDPNTGIGTLVASYGTENDLRGLAFVGNVLYGLADISTPDSLVTIDPISGAVTLVGATGRSDLQGLMATPEGELYAVGVSAGQIFRIDRNTGLATLIGGSVGMDAQGMEYAGPGRAWVARAELRLVDLTTGNNTIVGPLGVTDVRGLAAPVRGGKVCYANCDGSTAAPVLNVNDFICFQSAFAAGDSYANCDQSTTEPVLNVNDFICFQGAFAAGCP